MWKFVQYCLLYHQNVVSTSLTKSTTYYENSWTHMKTKESRWNTSQREYIMRCYMVIENMHSGGNKRRWKLKYSDVFGYLIK